MPPEKGKTSQDPYWDIKRSIANAIARSKRPSLLRLHNEILEEFGYRPDLELVDYFCSIAEVDEEEIADYFCRIARPVTGENSDREEVNGRGLADRIADGPEPTVLRFRTEYENRFNVAPSEDLLRYFLRRMQETGGGATPGEAHGSEAVFAAGIAGQQGATVLKFRQEYLRKYGKEPPETLTRFFLRKKQELAAAGRRRQPGAAADAEAGRPGPDNGEPDREDSRVNFARTVANGLVTTVLQFRKTYEKAYGEAPTAELIKVFLKSLPRS